MTFLDIQVLPMFRNVDRLFLVGRGGFSTVLVPQLRKANQTITIEQFSWLPALQIYNGIPWIIILSYLTDAIGRKKTHIIVCVFTLLYFIFLYFNTYMTHFLITEFFSGPLTATFFTLLPIIFNECISSKNKSIFLPIKSASFSWGVLAANTIGTYFHWRNIVILGLVCSVYTLINVSIWPESPFWLAARGKLDECTAAHRWLKGQGQESERELEYILKTCDSKRLSKNRWTLSSSFQILFKKQFYWPILLAIFLICLYCFSGKYICTVFALEIFKQIAVTESTAYKVMLILDGVAVVSMYLGSLLSKFVKRRVFLISLSILAIASMLSISLVLYLVKLSIIAENTYLSLVLIAIYSITTSCGPQMMSVVIIVELIPSKSRIVSVCIIALSLKIINGTNTKLSPLYFKLFDIHGAFAFFALLSAIFLTLIYFYVPETKDKTIQQIDDKLQMKEKAKQRNEKVINRTIYNEIPAHPQ